jgi:hypothetical protein
MDKGEGNYNLEELPMEAQVNNLRRRLDDHITEHKTRDEEYEARQIRQDELHQQNMEAIADLTSATKDVVDAWVVANGLQRFVKWLSGFSFLGVVAAYLYKHW